MRSVDDLEVAGRTVLVRADLNVPLDNSGAAARHHRRLRIQASVPTISELVARGARVVVMAHLGRPKGEVKPELSLRPIARRLSQLLGKPVGFPGRRQRRHCRRGGAGGGRTPLRFGGVALLENLRFEAAETSKDDDERGAFADQLAALAGARRLLRRRRVRRGAPQARQRVRPAAATCRTLPVVSCWPRFRCCVGSPTNSSGRTWWCSAARKSPTSSA